MRLFGKGRNGSGNDTTVFFATDLHGSEVCFRKFVAAASFYGADLLVLGGDLTGKFVTPIVAAARAGGRRCTAGASRSRTRRARGRSRPRWPTKGSTRGA